MYYPYVTQIYNLHVLTYVCIRLVCRKHLISRYYSSAFPFLQPNRPKRVLETNSNGLWQLRQNLLILYKLKYIFYINLLYISLIKCFWTVLCTTTYRNVYFYVVCDQKVKRSNFVKFKIFKFVFIEHRQNTLKYVFGYVYH